MDIKQVIIIRKDLNMRKGKMIAQGAHASMKVFFDNIYTIEKLGQNEGLDYDVKLDVTTEMKEWIEGDFKKIVVSVNSAAELLDTKLQAENANIPCALIEDNGLTEFNGVKTPTAVAIGPARSEEIDKITKELKLL